MEDKILKTYPDKTIDELIAFIPWFANPTTGEVRYPLHHSFLVRDLTEQQSGRRQG